MTSLVLAAALSFAQEPPPPPEPAAIQAEIQRLEADIRANEQRIAELEARFDAAPPPLAQPPALMGPAGELSGYGRPVIIAPGETVNEAVGFGAPVTIEGHVLGNAVSFGSDVTVENGATVNGDAVSFGGRVVVEPGGAVVGDRISYGRAEARSATFGAIGGGNTPGRLRTAARKLVMLLAFAGAGVMVVGLFPRQVENVSESLSAHPFQSGMLGLVLTGLAGMLSLFLTLTIIGIPLVAVLLAAVLIAWLLGFVALCQSFGDRLPITNPGARRWLAFLFGVLAVGFVGALPLVGQLTLGVLGFACVGAALRTRFGTQSLT
ncbi:MAG: hypothetical protein H6739_06065 [Alphaproteobacteria bacterium]|nr:hypothetical protein [Alphaproteobacteria bacterium]